MWWNTIKIDGINQMYNMIGRITGSMQQIGQIGWRGLERDGEDGQDGKEGWHRQEIREG